MRKKLTKLSLILFTLQILFTGLFAQDEQKSEFVVQTGHTHSVKSVAFSPDGKLFASGSLDDTIKLWDAENGQELLTLQGHKNDVNSIVFSPDGKIIASGSYDKTIRLWDVERGQEIKIIKDRIGFHSVAFSPDGKSIASVSYKTIKLWDTGSGRELLTWQGHTSTINSVQFSPNGELLVTGSLDNTIKLWNAENGKELRIFLGHNNFVNSVAFSLDGKMLASGSCQAKNDYVCTKGEIKLWDVSTGKELRTLNGHTDYVNSVAFSPDGKSLASGSRDFTIRLWDIESGQETQKFLENKTIWDPVNSVAFSPDGKKLVSGSLYAPIRLWNVTDGREIKKLKTNTSYAISFAFSPDSKKLVTGSVDETIRLWDLSSGQQLRSFVGHNDSVGSIAFSPNGRFFASGSRDSKIKLWDIESGQELKTLEGHSTYVTLVAFSPNGKKIASVGLDKTIKLWDVASGQELRTIVGINSHIRSVIFSPDGKMLASGHNDKYVRLWDVASGQELKSFEAHLLPVLSVVFSPDGKMLASVSRRNINIWNIKDGKLIKGFQKTDPKTFTKVSSLIPDFYKTNKDEPISPDRKYQIKQGKNNKLNLTEFDTGKVLANLIAFGTRDWAVTTPEGLFDTSPDTRKFMHYIIGLEPIALEQMKDLYYVPGLLQKIFKGEPLPKVELFSKKDLFPLAEYEQPKPDQKVLDVKLTNRGGGIGQVQVLVNGKEFIKDARPAGFDSKQATLKLKIPLENAPFILGEKNKIEVVSRNAAGSLSSRGSSRGVETFQTFNYGIKREKPNVYAIIGGVSDYTGDGLDLKYAAKDAEDFAKAFEAGANNLFGADKVHIRLLTSNGENSMVKFTAKDTKISKATKADFKQAFEDFKDATPNDIFIVYLAGHGVSIKTNREQVGGDLYLYLTQEAYTPDMPDKKLRDAMAISSEELTELMKQNKALKQVLVLDTCAAGGAVEAINSLVAQRNLPNEDAQIRAIDRLNDRTGFFVLMGSAANKVSYEAEEYGQGLLTYSLLEGMKGAKLREGEFADVSLLFNYAQDKVPTLAKDIGGIQRPLVIAPDFVRESSQNKPETSGSFDIGRFSKSEQNQISLSTKKPRILKPRLINSVTISDDLELEVMLRKALRNASFAVERGGQNANRQTSIVFVEADEMSDAIKPNGLYTINGEKIELTLNLIRNKERIETIKLTGNKNSKDELIKKIIKVLGNLK